MIHGAAVVKLLWMAEIGHSIRAGVVISVFNTHRCASHSARLSWDQIGLIDQAMTPGLFMTINSQLYWFFCFFIVAAGWKRVDGTDTMRGGVPGRGTYMNSTSSCDDDVHSLCVAVLLAPTSYWGSSKTPRLWGDWRGECPSCVRDTSVTTARGQKPELARDSSCCRSPNLLCHKAMQNA